MHTRTLGSFQLLKDGQCYWMTVWKCLPWVKNINATLQLYSEYWETVLKSNVIVI